MARQIGAVSKVITGLPPGGYWPDLIYDVYDVDNVPAAPGFRIADNMGRAWRLVETSEAVTMGNMMTNLVTEVAIATSKLDADTIGTSSLDIDITVTANAYDNGLLIINAGTGLGYIYPVISNTAGTASTTDSVVVIEGGLVVALSASDSAGMLCSSPFWNVSQHNPANPCVEVGIGRCMATTDSTDKYCWAQTYGICLLKAGTGAVGAGDTIGLAEDDAGAVETLVTTEDPAFVGVSYQAISDGTWGLCGLRIFP